jgi:hypothetical protein
MAEPGRQEQTACQWLQDKAILDSIQCRRSCLVLGFIFRVAAAVSKIWLFPCIRPNQNCLPALLRVFSSLDRHFNSCNLLDEISW